MARCRVAFSSALSQLATAGRSVIRKKTTMPRITAGSPSSRNMVCQPFSPRIEVPSSAVDTGAPSTLESGIASMNIATIRPRCAQGNQ